MKTINFKLSKRLNDLGLLDEVETEYCFFSEVWKYDSFQIWESNKITEGEFYDIWESLVSYCKVAEKYKTLTLSEAIEFLPNIENYYLEIKKIGNIYWIKYEDKTIINLVHSFISLSSIRSGETLLLAIEKMLEYLLDNNLLFKK